MNGESYSPLAAKSASRTMSTIMSREYAAAAALDPHSQSKAKLDTTAGSATL